MSKPVVLAIDGNSYDGVIIIDYEVTPEILDGPGTGRTQGPGWPMFREPEGVIINVKVVFGLTNSANPDFISLYNKVLSLGSADFVNVTLRTPVGELVNQEMYAKPGGLKAARITRDGEVYTSTWGVNFIAKEAILKP